MDLFRDLNNYILGARKQIEYYLIFYSHFGETYFRCGSCHRKYEKDYVNNDIYFPFFISHKISSFNLYKSDR